MSEKLPLLERVKVEGNALRGTIAESIKDELTGSMREEDTLLMKFHGMYQQDDRDRREERAKKKLERLYSFMIRLRMPGGILTSEQWLALNNIAGKDSTNELKVTTRQTIQLHGVLKSRLKPTHRVFNSVHLDTIAACGDDNRNVTCSPNPVQSPFTKKFFLTQERSVRC